jgi:hypothetical protein
VSDWAATVLRMGSNGDAVTTTPKNRRKPTTERGARLLAFIDARGGIRAVSRATGLHQATIVRAVHNDPAAQSVATHDALIKLGVPPELLSRTG